MLPDDELLRLRYAADFSVLPRGLGLSLASGRIRSEAADFQVVEELPFAPAGEGEHLYLRVRKTGQNTRWVAKRIADAAGVRYAGVGFAGLKDRHAVTDQWFSIHVCLFLLIIARYAHPRNSVLHSCVTLCRVRSTTA